ncbi:MAG TPA: nucleotidyltransferase family protein [Oscillospiraceae bacterium]|nr:nucleotidyltransferase family protein [Oscillospiraceae bacterium]
MVDVVILAGTAKQSELTISEKVQNKAFVQIHGQAMLSYVLDALQQASSVNRIAIVGPLAELQTLIGASPQLFAVAEGDTIVENLQLGFAALQPKQHCLVVTADVAFLTAAAVEDFLAACQPYESAVYYPIVAREDNDRRFPGVKRTYVKIHDGEFTGGNLFLVDPACLTKVLPRLEHFFALRKSPLRLAGALGLGFVVKLLTKRLTIAELEKRFYALFAVAGKAVISQYAEIGTDVDKPADLELARQHLKTQL